MGEFSDKVKGTANKVSGAVKDGIGEATGNERLEAEGEAQKAKGKAQTAAGSIKGALGDKF